MKKIILWLIAFFAIWMTSVSAQEANTWSTWTTSFWVASPSSIYTQVNSLSWSVYFWSNSQMYVKSISWVTSSSFLDVSSQFNSPNYYWFVKLPSWSTYTTSSNYVYSKINWTNTSINIWSLGYYSSQTWKPYMNPMITDWVVIYILYPRTYDNQLPQVTKINWTSVVFDDKLFSYSVFWSIKPFSFDFVNWNLVACTNYTDKCEIMNSSDWSIISSFNLPESPSSNNTVNSYVYNNELYLFWQFSSWYKHYKYNFSTLSWTTLNSSGLSVSWNNSWYDPIYFVDWNSLYLTDAWSQSYWKYQIVNDQPDYVACRTATLNSPYLKQMSSVTFNEVVRDESLFWWNEYSYTWSNNSVVFVEDITFNYIWWDPANEWNVISFWSWTVSGTWQLNWIIINEDFNVWPWTFLYNYSPIFRIDYTDVSENVFSHMMITNADWSILEPNWFSWTLDVEVLDNSNQWQPMYKWVSLWKTYDISKSPLQKYARHFRLIFNKNKDSSSYVMKWVKVSLFWEWMQFFDWEFCKDAEWNIYKDWELTDYTQEDLNRIIDQWWFDVPYADLDNPIQTEPYLPDIADEYWFDNPLLKPIFDKIKTLLEKLWIKDFLDLLNLYIPSQPDLSSSIVVPDFSTEPWKVKIKTVDFDFPVILDNLNVVDIQQSSYQPYVVWSFAVAFYFTFYSLIIYLLFLLNKYLFSIISKVADWLFKWETLQSSNGWNIFTFVFSVSWWIFLFKTFLTFFVLISIFVPILLLVKWYVLAIISSFTLSFWWYDSFVLIWNTITTSLLVWIFIYLIMNISTRFGRLWA